MIEISINDSKQTLDAECLLSDFLQTQAHLQEPEAAFAVALNGEFVPRSRYDNTLIKHADTLDIVSPVGGG